MAYLDLFKYLPKVFKGLLLSQGFVVTPELLARVAPEMLPNPDPPQRRGTAARRAALEASTSEIPCGSQRFPTPSSLPTVRGWQSTENDLE